MSASSRSLAGALVLLSLLAFADGGLCIREAKRDIAVAPNESTALGVAHLHSQSTKSDIFDSLRCDYIFNVNGSDYYGYGICPKQTDHSVRGTTEILAGLLPNPNVTVYYDPADPSFNGMMEFVAKSAYDYKKAKIAFGVGVVLLLFSIVGSLLLAGLNNSSRGIVVDAEGTVIHPDQIDSEQQS
jgi:hypothetical protein